MWNFLCNLFGHKVDRHRVWHDGIDYRSTCMRCKNPMIRALDGWRPFDNSTDNDSKRQPHPHFGESQSKPGVN